MKKILWLMVISLGLSFLFSCLGLAVEPIKIAAIFAKTGIGAQTNKAQFNMVALAVGQINKQGGVLGRQIEVVELDNQSTALGSKEAALEAVKRNVTAVIGAAWSSHSLAIAPVLQQAGIAMITPISTSPQVTLIGDYIFRVCFTDPFQGKVMATFALKDLKAKTAVILTNVNSDYSLGLTETFKKTAAKIGLKILWEGSYGEKDVDFSEILKKTKDIQPDVIFMPGYSRDSGLLIKQARKMGIKADFLGGDGWSIKMYEFGENYIDGGYFSAHWHLDAPFSKGRQVQTDYRAKYLEDMPEYIPLTYDAVMLLADAITRAGSLDHKAIRDALASTKNFQGATGTITFDENRDPLNKDAVVLKFDRGTTVFVKSIKPQ